MKSLIHLLAVAGVLASTALADAPPADPSVSTTRALIDTFRQDRRALERLYDIDISSARRDRLEKLFTKNQHALDQLDFSNLNQSGKVDWLLFQNYLRFENEELDAAAKKTEATSALLPFAQTIISLEEARRQLHEQDPEKCAARVATIAPRSRICASSWRNKSRTAMRRMR